MSDRLETSSGRNFLILLSNKHCYNLSEFMSVLC